MPKRDELKEPTRWVTAARIARAPRCLQQTLRNWSDKGILSIRKTPGGRFHYSIPVGKQDDSVKENVIYARVSSAKQKADLVRVDFCDTVFPNHKVVTDVGSGVNFKRKAYSAF
jgi:predicted site-specific integrase-resolvase